MILVIFIAILIILLLIFNIADSIAFLEYIWKTSLLGLFLVFGYLLIKNNSREIRQKKKMEEITKQLQKANLRFKELNKTKSEFISIASHQLRTPLSIIIGYLSMILEGAYGKISKKTVRPISNAFLASQQLNRLVNTLLNVSHIEAGKIKLEAEKMPVKKILEPIIEEFEITAQKKGLYLNLSIPASLPQISLDREKINQVIINVIDNAIKYTEIGGIIVEATTLKNKDKILIQIADTGLGMDKKQITQIFKKFKRGSAGEISWSSGAGLGLFVAKKFTELHDGKIWAESKGINKGSTFYIELPLG